MNGPQCYVIRESPVLYDIFADLGCHNGVDDDAGLVGYDAVSTDGYCEEGKIVCNRGKYLQIETVSYTGTLGVCWSALVLC